MDSSNTSNAPSQAGSDHLVHIHGFSPDVSGLIWFSEPERLVYAAGCRIILLAGSTQSYISQKHPITALCGVDHSFQNSAFPLTSEPLLGVATYTGTNAELKVMSLTSKRRFGPFRYKSKLSHVCFSNNGALIVGIASNRDHTIIMWDLRKPKIKPLEYASYASPVLGCISPVHPKPRFISFGVAHIKFWQLDTAVGGKPCLEGRRGTFGTIRDGPLGGGHTGGPKTVTTVCDMGKEKVAVGGSEGQVYIFEKTHAKRMVRLPQSTSPIVWIHNAWLGLNVCSADGRLSHIEDKTKCIISSLQKNIDPNFQSTVLRGVNTARCAVFMTKSHLLRVDDDKKKGIHVLAEQPRGEILSMASHPKVGLLVGAVDGTVMFYKPNQPAKKMRAASAATTVAISHSLESPWIAIGCDNGTLEILASSDYHYVYRRLVSQKGAAIVCSAFGNALRSDWLAVGDKEGVVTVFRFKDLDGDSYHSGAEVVVKCAQLRGHTSSLHSMQFEKRVNSPILLTLGVDGRFVAYDVQSSHRVPIENDVRVSPWNFPSGSPVEHLPKFLRANELKHGFVGVREKDEASGRSFPSLEWCPTQYSLSPSTNRGRSSGYIPLQTLDIFPKVGPLCGLGDESLALASGTCVSIYSTANQDQEDFSVDERIRNLGKLDHWDAGFVNEKEQQRQQQQQQSSMMDGKQHQSPSPRPYESIEDDEGFNSGSFDEKPRNDGGGRSGLGSKGGESRHTNENDTCEDDSWLPKGTWEMDKEEPAWAPKTAWGEEEGNGKGASSIDEKPSSNEKRSRVSFARENREEDNSNKNSSKIPTNCNNLWGEADEPEVVNARIGNIMDEVQAQAGGGKPNRSRTPGPRIPLAPKATNQTPNGGLKAAGTPTPAWEHARTGMKPRVDVSEEIPPDQCEEDKEDIMHREEDKTWSMPEEARIKGKENKKFKGKKGNDAEWSEPPVWRHREFVDADDAAAECETKEDPAYGTFDNIQNHSLLKDEAAGLDAVECQKTGFHEKELTNAGFNQTWGPMARRNSDYDGTHWTTTMHQSIPLLKDPSQMRPAGKVAYHLGHPLPTSCSSILSNAPSPPPPPSQHQQHQQFSATMPTMRSFSCTNKNKNNNSFLHKTETHDHAKKLMMSLNPRSEENSVRCLIGPDRGWGDIRDASGLRETLSRRREKSEQVSVKIGARVRSGSFPSRSQLNSIQDTLDMKESVIKRQQYDAVHELLSQHSRDDAVHRNKKQTVRTGTFKGPFRYKVDQGENQWCIDVELPNGTLTKALRNQHRHVLIFEGEVAHNWKRYPPQVCKETFEIAVPGEFDHMSENMRVVKRFGEGRCAVTVPRHAKKQGVGE